VIFEEVLLYEFGEVLACMPALLSYTVRSSPSVAMVGMAIARELVEGLLNLMNLFEEVPA